MRQIRDYDSDTYSPYRQALASGIESVVYIRCMNHRAVPQFNDNENGVGECGACISDALEGVITAVIDAIGGTVEGQPTSRVNFLQRVRELAEFERRHGSNLEGRQEA